jgi:3-oxoadipate enol-lactonase
VITCDLRGHGESGSDNQPLSLDLHVADIAGLLDKTKAGRAVIVGHSLGGSVAIQTATTHPDKVRAIILANSAGVFPPFSAEMARKRETALELFDRGDIRPALDTITSQSFSPGFREEHPDIYDWLLSVRLKNRPEDIERQWRSPAQKLPIFNLDRVNCPALFIAGRNDLVLPLQTVEETCRKIPGAKLAVLPAGHAMPVEMPDVFNAAVNEFLGTLN